MKKVGILFLMIFVLNGLEVSAQDQIKYIELSGKVTCIDPIEGTLADVTVYNKTRGWGTYTNEEGEFSINMGKNDTLVFSTIQHLDYVFQFNKKEGFKDKYIEFMMETDTIWLNTVTVIGKDSWDEFKSKFINMDIPVEKIDMHLPAVKSYAKLLSDVNGDLAVSGPLTHIYNKFKKVRILKGKIDLKNQLILPKE